MVFACLICVGLALHEVKICFKLKQIFARSCNNEILASIYIIIIKYLLQYLLKIMRQIFGTVFAKKIFASCLLFATISTTEQIFAWVFSLLITKFGMSKQHQRIVVFIAKFASKQRDSSSSAVFS